MPRVIQTIYELIGKDSASAALKKIDDKVKETSSTMDSAWKGAALAATGLNQTLEIGKKIWEASARVIGESVKTTLAWRAATDPARVQIERFGERIEGLRARFGDAFTPTLRGVAEAFTPLIGQAESWFKANAKIIQSGVLEWSMALGHTLVSAVAAGVMSVAQAWYGWDVLIARTKQVAGELFSRLNVGFAAVLRGSAAFAAALGKDELADKLSTARKAAQELADEYQNGADKESAAAAQAERALASVQRQVDKVADAINVGIEQAGVKAHKHLGESATLASEREREAAKAAKTAWLEMMQGMQDALLKIRAEDLAEQQERDVRKVSFAISQQSKAWTRAADDSEAYAKKFESRSAKIKDALHGVVQDAVSSFSHVGEVVDGKLVTIGDAFAGFLKNLGAQIVAFIADRAVLLLLELLADAATGFLPTSVLSFLGLNEGGGVRGFAGGGPVSGGVPGRDSVPALLTPGEYVLPVPVVRAIQSGGPPPPAGPQTFSAGGGVRPAAQPAASTLVVQTLIPPDRAAVQKFVRDSFLPVWRDLQRSGAL